MLFEGFTKPKEEINKGFAWNTRTNSVQELSLTKNRAYLINEKTGQIITEMMFLDNQDLSDLWPIYNSETAFARNRGFDI